MYATTCEDCENSIFGRMQCADYIMMTTDRHAVLIINPLPYCVAVMPESGDILISSLDF